MKINKIRIENYRCFADLTLELDPRLTVIVALNGQGKSALLDAIKVTLWPFVAGFDLGSTTNDTTGIQIDDVRRELVQAHEMEWRLPSEMAAEGTLRVRSLLQADALSSPLLWPDDTILSDDVPWRGKRYRESIKKNTKTKNRSSGLDAVDLAECAKALQKRIFSDTQGQPDDLPLLAYYGTARLWSHKKLVVTAKTDDGESLSRTYAYRICA